MAGRAAVEIFAQKPVEVPFERGFIGRRRLEGKPAQQRHEDEGPKWNSESRKHDVKTAQPRELSHGLCASVLSGNANNVNAT